MDKAAQGHNKEVVCMEWKPMIYRGIDFSERYKISDNGDIFSIRSNKMLKQNLINGYLGCVVSLGKRGKQKSIKVHIAVAENFIKNSDPNKNEINHIDGDKTNNKVSNLEWVTRGENARNASECDLFKTTKIRCTTTGVTFNSLAKAARWCGLKGRDPFGEYFQKESRKSCGKHPITKEKLQWELI